MPSGPQGSSIYDCDLLVAGSGAGGLSAAVTAAALGFDVIVVEKAPVYGGTTAWSDGWMWIPRNPLAVVDCSVGNYPHLFERAKPGSHHAAGTADPARR